MSTKDKGFSSQREAVKAARIAIWGDVPFAKRTQVDPKCNPAVAFWDDRGLPVIAVSANVNDRLVVIHFDHYGRLAHEAVTVLSRIGKDVS